MPPLQIAVRPRLYTAFPGRRAPALALDAALHLDGARWGAGASFAYLPRARLLSEGDLLEQDGYGGAAELRYYWRYSRSGAIFLGPRAEAWSVGQVLNGRDYGRAGLLGAFAGLGLERALPYSFSLALSAEAGMFLSRDGRGDPRRTPSFPLVLALRYGP